MIELDRGMEHKVKFRDHVRGRINYIQSGEYKKTFQTEYATIAYVTTGQTPEYRETRSKNMCLWLRELLDDMRLKDWGMSSKSLASNLQAFMIMRYLREKYGTDRMLRKR